MNRTLAELLASAEKKKREDLCRKLGLSASTTIAGLQLESLAYHLLERSGAVQVEWVGDLLRVGEPGNPAALRYKGEAAEFLLQAWGVTRDQALKGIVFEVKDGKRVGGAAKK